MTQADRKSTVSAARQKYDTNQIIDRERFDYYREVLGRDLLRLTPDPPETGKISAAIDCVALDDNVSISRVELSPHRVRRTANDILRSNQDLYHLGLNYDGVLYRSIEGEPVLRRRNELYFSDSSVESEYIIGGTSNVKLLCIVFPKELVARHTDTRLAGGLDITPNLKNSAIFKSVGLLNRRLSTASVDELKALSSAIILLLAASLMEEADRSHAFAASGSSNKGMLMLAKDIIEFYLPSNYLSDEFVAQKLGIYSRYLAKIFEDSDLSFHRYVVSKRLDCIRNDLISNKLKNESIMCISRKWGINDATTLYRNYKSKFSETPRHTRLLVHKPGRTV